MPFRRSLLVLCDLSYVAVFAGWITYTLKIETQYSLQWLVDWLGLLYISKVGICIAEVIADVRAAHRQ